VDKKNKHKTELGEEYWALMSRVAGNIRRIRLSENLTQEDMLLLGLERRWFQRIESGTYSVSLPTLCKVARALQVDIAEFFK
jgi:transcriptional regulator with XRE-family HTH domain